MKAIHAIPFPLAALLPHLEATGDCDPEQGEARSRLSCNLDLGQGRHAHLDLIEVSVDDDLNLDAVNPVFAYDLDLLARLSGCLRSDLTTVEIQGRRYVLCVYPFAC